jgi:hypothetical protein
LSTELDTCTPHVGQDECHSADRTWLHATRVDQTESYVKPRALLVARAQSHDLVHDRFGRRADLILRVDPGQEVRFALQVGQDEHELVERLEDGSSIERRIDALESVQKVLCRGELTLGAF